jgi:hypothetical protein
MRRFKVVRAVAMAVPLMGAGIAWGAPVTVVNSNFDDSTGVTWGNPADIGTPNEEFTNPPSFGPGWAVTGPITGTTGGRYGLQQPRSGTGTNQHFYNRSSPAGTTPPGTLSAPFNGNLIGFINLDDIDGGGPGLGTTPNYAQSAVVGNLAPGTYTLQVALGFRAGQNWNDVKYTIGMVAAPSTSGNGTTGGTALGTHATKTMTLATDGTLGSNIHDLSYVLTVPEGDSSVGLSYAIRIHAQNLGTQNGVPNADPNNLTFVQANFDNVRLDFVEAIPEPSSLALLGLGALGMLRRRRGN